MSGVLSTDEILAVSVGGGEYELKRADVDDVLVRFTYHTPVSGQVERYGDIRHSAKVLALGILQSVPAGRERSLALTKLEEMVFWANAGIARGERG